MTTVLPRRSTMHYRFGPILPRSFYARSTETVARDLLGRVIEHDRCAGKIVETEAYLGLEDLAAHSSRGITPRTSVIFGPPGHAYVYLIYGIYDCLNLVADVKGRAGCVLIRALEPLEGINEMRERRGRDAIRDLASGPGKLTIAMGITRKLNGADVTSGNLVVRRGTEDAFETGVSKRIGITHCADWPLRFFISGNGFVSRLRGG